MWIRYGVDIIRGMIEFNWKINIFYITGKYQNLIIIRTLTEHYLVLIQM